MDVYGGLTQRLTRPPDHLIVCGSMREQLVSPARKMFGPVRRRVSRRFSPSHFKETYLNDALSLRSDSVYVEIGVRHGDSFRFVKADRKFAVDTSRSRKLQRLKQGEQFFEMPSDEFFAIEAPNLFGNHRIDAALVDGLHEFRQALRDVVNLERFMAPDGLIVVDDCNPLTRERANDVQCPGLWNGDVWKVAAFLRKERPDLRFLTVDADQGIGLLSGFSGPPPPPSEDVVAKYKALDYSHLAVNREGVLGLAPPE